MRQHEEIFLQQIQAFAKAIIDNTPTTVDNLKPIHRHFLSLHVKAIFESFKIDMNDFVQLMPTISLAFRPDISFTTHSNKISAFQLRNGLVHGYFAITPMSLHIFCRTYIPALYTKIDNVLNGRGYTTIAPAVESYNLITQTNSYASDTTNRTAAQYGRDLLEHAQWIRDFSISTEEKEEHLKYPAIQNCIEIYGETCKKILLIKTVSDRFVDDPESKITQSLIDSTNTYRATSIINASNIRDRSSHEIIFLSLRQMNPFINSASQLLEEKKLENAVLVSEGKASLPPLPEISLLDESKTVKGQPIQSDPLTPIGKVESFQERLKRQRKHSKNLKLEKTVKPDLKQSITHSFSHTGDISTSSSFSSSSSSPLVDLSITGSQHKKQKLNKSSKNNNQKEQQTDLSSNPSS